MSGSTGLPERGPGAIRAALATHADPGVAEKFQAAWATATEAARDQLSLEPINECLDTWRGIAYEWVRDPAGYRSFLARMGRYVDSGEVPETRTRLSDAYLRDLLARKTAHGGQ